MTILKGRITKLTTQSEAPPEPCGEIKQERREFLRNYESQINRNNVSAREEDMESQAAWKWCGCLNCCRNRQCQGKPPMPILRLWSSSSFHDLSAKSALRRLIHPPLIHLSRCWHFSIVNERINLHTTLLCSTRCSESKGHLLVHHRDIRQRASPMTAVQHSLTIINYISLVYLVVALTFWLLQNVKRQLLRELKPSFRFP